MEVPQENYLCTYLKPLKMLFFFLLQNQRTGRWNRFCLGGLVPVEMDGIGEHHSK
jgi:hypothetical protein